MEINFLNYIVSTISMLWIPLTLTLIAILAVTILLGKLDKTDPFRRAMKGTRTCLLFIMVLIVLFGMSMNVKVHGPRFVPHSNVSFEREAPSQEIQSIAPELRTYEERMKETNEKTTSGNIPR